jgi:succinoglycan biosynthesis transport protein ExoP
MARTVHPFEYLAIAKRRRYWIIVPFALCLLVGLALALLLPKTYRSSATIAVQAPTVSPELVQARSALDTDERLRALSQNLKSPAVLERVAREEQLIGERPVEQVAAAIRSRINVEVPKPIARGDGRSPALNAVEIVYRDRSAERAQKIANRLAYVFVDEHARSRAAQAEGTAEFLGGQLRQSEQRISQLEQQLRAAKETNMGNLPEETLANLQTLAGVRQQLESTSNSLRGEQDRLALIERHIQSVRQGLYAAGPGGGASAGTSAPPQTRILMLQRELTAARAKYTDKHPEVQHLEHELATARADLAAARQQPDSAREDVMAADPTYQQLVAERDLVQLRIRGLRRSEAQLQADIHRYQRRVEAAPMVEQSLAPLKREYDLEKENYRQIVAKHGAALVQERIAKEQGGERFSVLYGAYFPDAPESPNRARILLMALIAGLALGGAAAFGREYLDWSVRDARALQDDFDVPVLAEIPRIGHVA